MTVCCPTTAASIKNRSCGKLARIQHKTITEVIKNTPLTHHVCMKSAEIEHVLVTKLLLLSSRTNRSKLEPYPNMLTYCFENVSIAAFSLIFRFLENALNKYMSVNTVYDYYYDILQQNKAFNAFIRRIRKCCNALNVTFLSFFFFFIACTFHHMQTVQFECETATWAALRDFFIFDPERFRKIYGSTSFTLSFIFQDVNFWTRLSPSGGTRSVKSEVYWQRCFLFRPAGTKHKTMLEARTGVGSIKSFPRPGVKSKLAAATKSSTGLQNKTFYCETCDVHVNSETQLKQVRPDKPHRKYYFFLKVHTLKKKNSLLS